MTSCPKLLPVGLFLAGLIGCAELTPSPDGTGGTGGGGASGSGGEGGGSGSGGTQGQGGAGGTAEACEASGAGPLCNLDVAGCTELVWQRTTCLEPADCPSFCALFAGADTDPAVGFVSSDPADDDALDAWFVTAPDGTYDITLQWDGMAVELDLDLRGNGVSATEVPPSDPRRREETLAGVALTTSEPFFIEVEAVSTGGLSLRYNVFVVPSE